MKKIVIFLILAVLIGGITYLAMRDRGDSATAVTTQKATRGDITSMVTATGKVFPETEVKISSEVSGEIIEMPVREGQTVERGDLLLRVNPVTLEAQVLQSEAALRASQANSSEAEARMLQANLTYTRTQNLFEKGFATQDQVDEARTAYEVSRAAFSATQSRIEQQEMLLKEARDSFAKATTYSPMSGTISAIDAELGDRVVGTGQFEGTEIMRVADLERMEVHVDVSEADIVAVKVGDPATIEIDALPNEQFEAEVSEIASSATSENQSSQDQLTTFLVKVRLLDPNDSIRPGMTATADIQTETVTEVVRVPLQAVTVRPREEVRRQLGEENDEPEGGNPRAMRDNLRRVVFIVRNGTAILTPVETGIADNRMIEIRSGVEVDDEIVTGSYSVLSRDLIHNAPVTVENIVGPGGFGGRN